MTKAVKSKNKKQIVVKTLLAISAVSWLAYSAVPKEYAATVPFFQYKEFLFIVSILLATILLHKNKKKNILHRFYKEKEPLVKKVMLGLLVLIATLELATHKYINNIDSTLSENITHIITPLSGILTLAAIFIITTFISVKSPKLYRKINKKKNNTKKYKKWYAAIILALIISYIGIGQTQLENLEPYTDEYLHLVRAQAIHDTGNQEYFINQEWRKKYNRSNFVTYIATTSFKIFDESLYAARIPGVIASALAIIPLYFIGRYVNRNVGLISAALWLLSPWSIAVARNVREYAYFPALFCLMFLFFLKLNKHIEKLIETKKILNKNTIVYSILFLLPLVYAFKINPFSTFKQIIVLYIVFLGYNFVKILQSKKVEKKYKISLILLSIIAASSVFFINIGFVEKTPTYLRYWSDLLFTNNSTQWFFNSSKYIYIIALIIGSIYAAYTLTKKKHNEIGFLLLTFLGYFYIFSFHFGRYARPRYGYILLIWIIPLVATGIYILIKKIHNKESFIKTTASTALLSFLLIATINPLNTLSAITNTQHESTPITNEYHDKYLPVLKKYGPSINKNDTIICSLCPPLFWHNQADLENNNVYTYLYSDSKRFQKNEQIIKNNDSGWIILDQRRNNQWSKGYKKENFTVADKEVEFLEMLSGFYIYKWE